MKRLTRVVSAASFGVAALLLATCPLEAQGAPGPAVSSGELTLARASRGSITGTVMDERGGGLAGAMVSALGATMASTTTDQTGRFALDQLPPGEYLLRAHMLGFMASAGAVVRVGVTPAVHRFQLRRVTGAAAPAGATPDSPVEARPIIAAGFDLPHGAVETGADADGDADDHPHTETAWRLRHIKRSILKDAAPLVVLADDEPDLPPSRVGRAVGSAAGLATSLLSAFPISGEVNLLTTAAMAPGAVLSATAFPRGVAYLALAAPAPGGEWSIRAAMSEGDLSSWIVAGAFSSDATGSHAYDFGLSYSTQEYVGGNPAALAAVSDGRRNVGELYAFDRWAVGNAVTVDYGARYGHYGYLEERSVISPRLGVMLQPFERTRIRASAAQQMVAPGAEEFLPTHTRGPSLPPERTFAPLGEGGGVNPFRIERARSFEVSVERELGDAFVVGVGRFRQSVDDQLVTLFGLGLPGGPRSVGHYYVGTVGGVDAEGWTVRFDSPEKAPIQGSVRYSVARANWTPGGSVELLRTVAPAAARGDAEDLHDVTGSFRADISETATRVSVLYKVSTGYVRSDASLERPGFDGRFDLQINQALPVGFAGTRWEVLIGLRNLFRDPLDAASIFDELLVVRPPKRVVGGFLVRF